MGCDNVTAKKVELRGFRKISVGMVKHPYVKNIKIRQRNTPRNWNENEPPFIIRIPYMVTVVNSLFFPQTHLLSLPLIYHSYEICYTATYSSLMVRDGSGRNAIM